MEQKTYNFEAGEVLLFNKPLGWTSNDLVKKIKNRLKNITQNKKIKLGHAGTLDPLADGLMILCSGKATKTIDQIQAQTKHYTAQLELGSTTPSFDKETEIDQYFNTEHIDYVLIEKIIEQFKGTQLQTPPNFSAKRINGQRAYKKARKGHDFTLDPVAIEIYELNILAFSGNLLTLDVVCSKGTYIRSLAHDIGKALQSGAHLSALRRTQIGHYKLEDAFEIDDFLTKFNIDTH